VFRESLWSGESRGSSSDQGGTPPSDRLMLSTTRTRQGARGVWMFPLKMNGRASQLHEVFVQGPALSSLRESTASALNVLRRQRLTECPRTNTSATPLVSPSTKFVASDVKATRHPVPAISTKKLCPPVACVPSKPTLARRVGAIVNVGLTHDANPSEGPQSSSSPGSRAGLLQPTRALPVAGGSRRGLL
jgi:hypothetical protein